MAVYFISGMGAGELSFGGIVAIEISTFISPEGIILLSSVATRQKLPAFFEWAGNFRLIV